MHDILLYLFKVSTILGVGKCSLQKEHSWEDQVKTLFQNLKKIYKFQFKIK